MQKLLIILFVIASSKAADDESLCIVGDPCYAACGFNNTVPAKSRLASFHCYEFPLTGKKLSALVPSSLSDIKVTLIYLQTQRVNCTSPFEVEVTSESFKNVKSVTLLHLRCIRISFEGSVEDSTNRSSAGGIDGLFFSHLPNLRYLTLNGLKATYLELDQVHHNFRTLYIISLENNGITAIQGDIFRNYQKLAHLRVIDRELTELSADMFDGLEKLKNLILTNVNVSVLRSDTLKRLKNLEYLGFFESSLEEIEDGCFDGLTHLEYVELSDNRLKKFPTMNIRNHKNLKTVILKGNNITTLDRKDIESFGAIEFFLDDMQLLKSRPNTFSGWHLKELKFSGFSARQQSYESAIEANFGVPENVTFPTMRLERDGASDPYVTLGI